ncbi:mitochondrial 54S ribosomal protein mrpl1 [Ascosphaera pollenicola]|nr:mitochondrial 54S ribosomal protein mrpl1 [Ascosphaera pollenicola]
MPPRRSTRKGAAASRPKQPEHEVKASPLPSPPPSPSEEEELLDAAMLDDEEMALAGTEAERAAAEGEQAKQIPAKGYVPGYNALKTFNGQVYSGMAIGGSHKWNYDQGVWTETKTEPDLWRVDFQTNKRRARNAPKNSGAPVGTEYHWLIVAHQHVKKLDANTYSTHLEGSKYKLAHKSVASNSWSIPTVKKQRERELDLLEDAKRRIQGLPPVMTDEKVKSETLEKGQRKLDTLFGKASKVKRDREDEKPASPSKRLKAETQTSVLPCSPTLSD